MCDRHSSAASSLRARCHLAVVCLLAAISLVHSAMDDDDDIRLERHLPIDDVDAWGLAAKQLLLESRRLLLSDDDLVPWQRQVRGRHRSNGDVTTGDAPSIRVGMATDKRADAGNHRAKNTHQDGGGRIQCFRHRLCNVIGVTRAKKRQGVMGLDNLDYAATLLDSGRRHQRQYQSIHQQQNEMSRNAIARLAIASQGVVDGLFGLNMPAAAAGAVDRDADRLGLGSDQSLAANQRAPNSSTLTSQSPALSLTMGNPAPHQQQRGRIRLPPMGVSAVDIRKMFRMINAG